ncbi:MAG: hypothetical protein GY930_19130 [bacterium]|nr:hypothetical protein [bacterium]
MSNSPATHRATPDLYWVSPLANPGHPPPRVRRAQSQTGPLKQIMRTHLRTFLDRSQCSGTPLSLPAHITRELLAFVRCGDPTFGFARLRCPACLFDQLIPFSCKAEVSTPPAPAGAWPQSSRTSPTTCCPINPCGNGSSPCPGLSAFIWPAVPPSPPTWASGVSWFKRDAAGLASVSTSELRRTAEWSLPRSWTDLARPDPFVEQSGPPTDSQWGFTAIRTLAGRTPSFMVV